MEGSRFLLSAKGIVRSYHEYYRNSITGAVYYYVRPYTVCL